ncbi:MAG: DNA cytosine methyltransferase [Candidatus Cloacimonetes bacterium]|nr:DNA cytosine methyltransferase [Candidatus Cloacimonadota bacterium]
MKSTAVKKYSIVDLFAGAGGLSYGFLQTGRFDVKAAFENNLNAQKTYKLNHGEADVYDDVADALTESTKQKLGKVDIVVGGPPCQGFSNANRQKNHAVSQNNSLVKKFVQAVLHLNPTAFVMENVSMLKSNIHQFYVDESDGAVIAEFGIKTIASTIPILDEEHWFDGADVFVSDPQSIAKHLWAESDYLILNVVFKNRRNEKKLTARLRMHQQRLMEIARGLSANAGDDHISVQERHAGEAIQGYFNNDQTFATAEYLCSIIEPSIMIQRMLSKAKEIHDNRIAVSGYAIEHGLVAKVRSMAVIDYVEAILGGSGYALTDGILSAASFGAPQKRMRFVVIGVKREHAPSGVTLPIGQLTEETYNSVKDAIGDIEDIETTHEVTTGDAGFQLPDLPAQISDLGRALRDSPILYNHVSTTTTPEALERFKAIPQGSNFHSLDPAMKTSYSEPTRTQNTIYLRLRYDEPSGTVINVRKSMWIHPMKDRALSVREAARLQTFPDSFVFCGTKDSQYQQVGNAVPPILAKAIAEHICRYLDDEESNE